MLAGQALADLVLSQVDTALRAEWRARDGDALHVGDEFCVIRGPGTRRASFSAVPRRSRLRATLSPQHPAG